MDTERPTVTVGIPFYNAGTYLNSAIRSVVNQTFTDWELLLVDDGSTDESAFVARRWTAHPRIRLIRDGHNRGLPTRLNQIAQWAQGRYLARMDADDVMVPHRLEKQVRFLEQHPETDLVGSYAYIIGAADELHGLRGRTDLPQTLRQAIVHTPLIHPTVTARREWFRLHSYYPALRRSQDQELWLRTILQSRFHVLDEPLLFYRELGLPQVEKYRGTASELRWLYIRYASRLGWLTVGLLCARLTVKTWTYRLFSGLGQEDVLLKKRSRPLTAEEAERAETLFAQSLSEPIHTHAV